MTKIAIALLGLLMNLLVAPAFAAGDDFTLEGYFAGKTKAVGTFSAINGVRRHFTVDLKGTWDGRTLTLREDFRFDDGTRDRKTWRFTKTAPGRYVGTREDVIGKTLVKIEGNTARFSYDVYLDPVKRENKVRFHDRMVLKADGTVRNTALVWKAIIPVARTVVEFRR